MVLDPRAWAGRRRPLHHLCLQRVPQHLQWSSLDGLRMATTTREKHEQGRSAISAQHAEMNRARRYQRHDPRSNVIILTTKQAQEE